MCWQRKKLKQGNCSAKRLCWAEASNAMLRVWVVIMSREPTSWWRTRFNSWKTKKKSQCKAYPCHIRLLGLHERGGAFVAAFLRPRAPRLWSCQVQICFHLLIMHLGFRNARYCDSIQSKLADCFKYSTVISTLVSIRRFFSCFCMPVELDWFLHDR